MFFQAYEYGVVISTAICSKVEQQRQNMMSDFKEFLHWLRLIFGLGRRSQLCNLHYSELQRNIRHVFQT